MAKLYLGVRIPNRAYERVSLDNVDMEQTVRHLKNDISGKISCSSDDIELVYCGSVLDDDEKLKELNIQPNTTLHVFKKTEKSLPYVSNNTYTEEDYQKIAEIFGTVTGISLNVHTRMNILQKILDEYPEFRQNLGAQALIRDSVLFNSLQKSNVIKKIAQNYSIICDAAEFIVKTTKKEIAKDEVITFSEESFSDFTSSSEEDTSNTSQTEQARNRRISRGQLAEALMRAGTASLNSLSNIAQRNLIGDEPQNPTTSSSSSTTTLSSSTNPRITTSIFSNALSQALVTASRPPGENDPLSMDTTESSTQPPNTIEDETRFTSERQLMREMGLNEDHINLQALILSNGDVEAAINLVFCGMNNLFN